MSNEFVKIGDYNELEILREVDFGLYLCGGDKDEGGWGQILLPNNQKPDTFEIGQMLNVFVYFDSEDRLIATCQRPRGKVGEFVFLRVADVNNAGAFLDWGLGKDLLCPYGQQSKPMREGAYYVIYIYQDNESDRISASSKLSRYLNNTEKNYELDDVLDSIVMAKTDLGYKVIVNNEHTAMLYHNEIFTELKIGQKLSVIVSKIREDEKIDVRLPQPDKKDLAELESNIIKRLSHNNGVLNLGDKTCPEEIYRVLSVSKKNFKRAISRLYKQRLIAIEDERITEITDK